MAVAVSEGGAVAVAVAVAGLTKRFSDHIQRKAESVGRVCRLHGVIDCLQVSCSQKDLLINVWGYKILVFAPIVFSKKRCSQFSPSPGCSIGDGWKKCFGFYLVAFLCKTKNTLRLRRVRNSF